LSGTAKTFLAKGNSEYAASNIDFIVLLGTVYSICQPIERLGAKMVIDVQEFLANQKLVKFLRFFDDFSW